MLQKFRVGVRDESGKISVFDIQHEEITSYSMVRVLVANEIPNATVILCVIKGGK